MERPRCLLFPALLATALLPWTLPEPAVARPLLGTLPVTLYGGLVQLDHQAGIQFVPENPPSLLEIRLHDDQTVELGAAGGGGGDAYGLSDSFSAGDQEVLAFQADGRADWLFLSAEPEALEIVIAPGQGVLVLPYDVGDTRRERAAEIAGGQRPRMTSRIFDAAAEWLAGRLEAASRAESADAEDAVPAASLSGRSLFSGTYTEYGCWMQEPNSPVGGAPRFIPASPPWLCGMAAAVQAAAIGQKSGKSAVFPFAGELPLGERTFRVYASESGAEHVVFSPEGDAVYLCHIPQWNYGIVFYDRGDTRRERVAQMSRNPEECPEPSFPQAVDVAKWAFAQPVKAVNPPPSMGGGGSGGGGQCPSCHGKGTIKVYSNPHGNPGPYFCGECGGSSYYSHYHQRCFACGGTGRQ